METLELVGLFAIVFSASLALAWALVAWRTSAAKVRLPVGTMLRMRGPLGMARATVEREEPEGWVVGSLLIRHGAEPPNLGDPLIVEAALDGGPVRFRSQVIRIEGPNRQAVIRRPAGWAKAERRQTPRARPAVDSALVEGESAQVIDWSEHGAKLVTSRAANRGERLRIDLPGEREPRYAWVLEALSEGNSGGHELRLVFEP